MQLHAKVIQSYITTKIEKTIEEKTIQKKLDADSLNIYINSVEFTEDIMNSIKAELHNVNEEIKRIKELFSNKRLYGNLIS